MPASVLEAPLVHGSSSCVCSSKNRSSSSILNVAKLAASFFCVYSAMDALSEYITSVLPHGLGDESLFLLQAALCASTVAAPAIVSSIGELKGMMLGGAAHATYLASLVRPGRYVVLGTSIFCGFGASLTWVAQGTFLTKSTPPSKRGLYTGVFWGIYSLSSIVGNLAAFFTFKYLSQAAMFGLGSCSAVLGVMLLFLVDSKASSEDDQELEESEGCQSCKCLLSTDELFLPEEDVPVPQKRTFLHFLLLLPITLYLGSQTAFWTGEFTKLLPAKTIGLVLFFTGIGQVIGSFLLSWLSDYLRCGTPTFLIGAIASATGLLVCFPLHGHRSSSNYELSGVFGKIFFGAPVLAYVAGLLFGIADGVLTSHVFAITGRIFQGSKPEIWALFNLLGTAGAAATFWIGIIFPIPKTTGLALQVWIQLVILFVGSPLYIVLDLWSAKFASSSLAVDDPLVAKVLNEPVIVVPVAA